MKPGKILIGFSLGLILIACDIKNESTVKASTRDVLYENMDSTVKPGTDIFQFANGGWIKKNPIPGDQGSWGIGHLVVEENLKRLHEIAEKSAAANAAKGSTEQKIGDFWSVAMDSVKIESQGLQPLKPWLDKINAITDVKSLVSAVAEFKKGGSSTLFSDYITQDDKNSEVMSYKLWQGGIGLPEREYYFKTDLTGNNLFIIGGEDKSVSQPIIDKADTLTSIPQFGKVNSLNMSVATAIILFERVRQTAEY